MSATGPSSRRSGFSIVEVVLAVGLVATAALAIVALLVYATQGAVDVKTAAAARRAASSVESWVAEQDFPLLYGKLRDSDEILLVCFEYRGGNSLRPDGTPQPDPDFEENDGRWSSAYARELDDPELDEDLAAADGTVFLCRVTLASLVDEPAPPLPSLAEFPLAALPLLVEMHSSPAEKSVLTQGTRTRTAYSFRTHAFR